MNTNDFNIEILPRKGYDNKPRVFLNKVEFLYRDTGISRDIYFGRKYVIKLEDKDSIKRYNQCKREYNYWRLLDEEDRKYFSPILCFGNQNGYNYIVQPRIRLKFIDNPDKEEPYITAWKTVEKLVNKYGLKDLHPDLGCNWTVWRNQPLINDYGW